MGASVASTFLARVTEIDGRVTPLKVLITEEDETEPGTPPTIFMYTSDDQPIVLGVLRDEDAAMTLVSILVAFACANVDDAWRASSRQAIIDRENSYLARTRAHKLRTEDGGKDD